MLTIHSTPELRSPVLLCAFSGWPDAGEAASGALDYLVAEWTYKPAGLVSYGGVSGGLRAAQALKLLLTTLKVMPIPEGVAVPHFQQFLDEDGTFKPNKLVEKSATTMLGELLRWAEALKPLRAA